MSVWRAFNNLRWFLRWPLKFLLFAVATLLVLYPKVWLIPVALERLGDINALLDPQHPELGELEDDVLAELPPDAQASDILPAVQHAVCQRVPYAWDWEIWGVVEYVPTVAEVFERGREDCDGRAVVAASLLRRMGYDAWLVSDLLHVWVETPQGETMSPTGAEKTLVGTETGTEATLSFELVRNLGRGLSYGVAVFPLTRELTLLAVLCALAIQPRSSGWRRVAGCLLLWIGLDLIRDAGCPAALHGRIGDVAAVWLGAFVMMSGWLVLVLRTTGRRRDFAATPAE
jgi:hypothetical protein